MKTTDQPQATDKLSTINTTDQPQVIDTIPQMNSNLRLVCCVYWRSLSVACGWAVVFKQMILCYSPHKSIKDSQMFTKYNTVGSTDVHLNWYHRGIHRCSQIDYIHFGPVIMITFRLHLDYFSSFYLNWSMYLLRYLMYDLCKWIFFMKFIKQIMCRMVY
jgi:hypothetical protein